MKQGSTKNTILDYLLHGIFLFIYGFVKYIPSPIGDLLRYIITRPFLKKAKKVRIGEGVTMGYPYRISMGNRVSLNEWVYLSGYGGLIIGDDVRIGHRTSIITSDHVFKQREIPIHAQGLQAKSVVIGNDVYIGCNCTILGGVTIGTGAVIAAGAVVTRDVKEYSIVAGVPAKQIANR